MYNEMSVTLISVSHDTVVSNKHEERTRHYYVNFQQHPLFVKVLFVALHMSLARFPSLPMRSSSSTHVLSRRSG